jgi:dUTP pyrophosphatase
MIKVKFVKTHPNAVLPKRNNTGTLDDNASNDIDNGTFGFHILRNDGDTGYDLTAVENTYIPPCDTYLTKDLDDDIFTTTQVGYAIVPVGLKLAEVEEGYWFRIEARSGLGFKHGIQPHFGIIDNQYRGDLAVKVYNLGTQGYHVKAGDRIAQIVFYPIISAQMEFVDEVTESARGEKGIGSSGK